MCRTDKKYVEFPPPFGTAEYTLRGVNDKEIRYKQYTDKSCNNTAGEQNS